MKRSPWIILLLLLGSGCAPKDGETSTGESVPCATLLTSQELRLAVAVPFNRVDVKPADPDSDSESHSSCTWEASSSASDAKIVIEFWDRKTIRREWRAKGTVPGFFDMFVESKKFISNAEPHVLEGVGERAVLYEERDWEDQPVLTMYVQLREGMSLIRTVGLSRREGAAIAKAVGESKP